MQPNACLTDTSSKESISCYNSTQQLFIVYWSLNANEVQAPLSLFYILVCLTSPFPPFSLLLPTWDPLLCQDGFFTLFPACKAAYSRGALSLLECRTMMTSVSIWPLQPGGFSELRLEHMPLSQVSHANQHTAGHVMGENNRRTGRSRAQVGPLQPLVSLGSGDPQR